MLYVHTIVSDVYAFQTHRAKQTVAGVITPARRKYLREQREKKNATSRVALNCFELFSFSYIEDVQEQEQRINIKSGSLWKLYF